MTRMIMFDKIWWVWEAMFDKTQSRPGTLALWKKQSPILGICPWHYHLCHQACLRVWNWQKVEVDVLSIIKSRDGFNNKAVSLRFFLTKAIWLWTFVVKWTLVIINLFSILIQHFKTNTWMFRKLSTQLDRCNFFSFLNFWNIIKILFWISIYGP